MVFDLGFGGSCFLSLSLLLCFNLSSQLERTEGKGNSLNPAGSRYNMIYLLNSSMTVTASDSLCQPGAETLSPVTHVCSCLVMAIPQVSLEEQKAPGALEGAGHCACEKDGHGHVAQGHRGTVVARTMCPSGCRCSCSSDPMKAEHRALPSPLALWSRSPKTKEQEQFPLMPCHTAGEFSSPNLHTQIPNSSPGFAKLLVGIMVGILSLPKGWKLASGHLVRLPLDLQLLLLISS